MPQQCCSAAALAQERGSDSCQILLQRRLWDLFEMSRTWSSGPGSFHLNTWLKWKKSCCLGMWSRSNICSLRSLRVDGVGPGGREGRAALLESFWHKFRCWADTHMLQLRGPGPFQIMKFEVTFKLAWLRDGSQRSSALQVTQMQTKWNDNDDDDNDYNQTCVLSAMWHLTTSLRLFLSDDRQWSRICKIKLKQCTWCSSTILKTFPCCAP